MRDLLHIHLHLNYVHRQIYTSPLEVAVVGGSTLSPTELSPQTNICNPFGGWGWLEGILCIFWACWVLGYLFHIHLHLNCMHKYTHHHWGYGGCGRGLLYILLLLNYVHIHICIAFEVQCWLGGLRHIRFLLNCVHRQMHRHLRCYRFPGPIWGKRAKIQAKSIPNMTLYKKLLNRN